MPATYKQRIQRKCFAGCARAWNDLPDECPEAPDCGGAAAKESVIAAHDEAGVMSSSYDFFMRCCLQLCDDEGNVTGDPTTCYPCDPNFDPLIEDPDNPETVDPGDVFNLSVEGGTAPYTWEWSSDPCGTFIGSPGATITVTAPWAGCCAGEFLVTDACNVEIYVGFRIVPGQWTELPTTACVMYGPETAQWERIHGIWKIEERLVFNTTGGCSDGCCWWCIPLYDRMYAWFCGQFDCTDSTKSPYCDEDVGCQVANACISENVRLGTCYTPGDICPIIGEDCGDPEESDECGITDFPTLFCLRYRRNYIWECL